MNQKTLHAVVAAYMALIFYLSAIRMPSLPPELKLANMDKLEHFAAYAVMGFLLAMDLRKSFCAGKTAVRIIGISFIITFSFGAFIEICQAFIPYRSAEALDAAANGAGGLTGAIIREMLFNKKGKNR